MKTRVFHRKLGYQTGPNKRSPVPELSVGQVVWLIVSLLDWVRKKTFVQIAMARVRQAGQSCEQDGGLLPIGALVLILHIYKTQWAREPLVSA
jgi:hypothetical protein